MSHPAPTALPIYAIGDIHGQFERLQRLWAQVETDARARWSDGEGRVEVVFLGDYIDRGPASLPVLQFCHDLWAGPPKWCRPIFLMGNHEAMLSEWLHTGSFDALMRWLYNGGAAVVDELRQQGGPLSDPEKQIRTRLPPHLMQFIQEELVLWYRRDPYLFVHAGIRPGVPLDEQQSHDLIWIRDDFTTSLAPHGFTVIHGHTPTDGDPHVRPNRINIDTGAAKGREITAVRLGEGAPTFFLA
jgi:serine/threonine protein phosphatase 1